MKSSEEIASNNAVSYVKKHNFDEEVLDFARACYYDGFKDGMQAHTTATLDTLKERVEGRQTKLQNIIDKNDNPSQYLAIKESRIDELGGVLNLIDEVRNE